MRQNIGTEAMETLTESQADLLEYHTVRLTSYAQKVVRTLAFATNFLSKDSPESDAQEFELIREGEAEVYGEDESAPRSGAAGEAVRGSSASGGAAEGCSAGEVKAPPTKRPSARKPLKLDDDEILNLYRSAQHEAAMEADWRGIQGPEVKKESPVGTSPTQLLIAGTTKLHL